MSTQFRVTRRGQELLAKAQTGIALKFTKIEIGDGNLGTTDTMFEMTGLVSPKSSHPITAIVDNRDGSASIKTVLNNTYNNERFYIKEMGIYADDPDIGEILYAVGNTSTSSDLFSANTDRQLTIEVEIIIIIGNAENVTIQVSDSMIWVTKAEHYNLAGTGRTTENVKKNADDIAALKVQIMILQIKLGVGSTGNDIFTISFESLMETEDFWGIWDVPNARLKC